jgi:hypothetical protein
LRPDLAQLAGFVLMLAAACCTAVPAFAACTAPSPPDPATRPAKLAAPVKGPCVDQKPGTPGCLGWEAYTFNDEVKAFNAKVPAFRAAADAYVAKLNAYVTAAAAYAKCEVETLNAPR